MNQKATEPSAQQFAADVADHLDYLLELRAMSAQDRLFFAQIAENLITNQPTEESDHGAVL